MLYRAFSRSGPNTAPRAHMGSPVWAASNHFTATSPESNTERKQKKHPDYSRKEETGISAIKTESRLIAVLELLLQNKTINALL